MATKYWQGGAVAVAQVSEGGIDTVDATPSNNTFTVTIGGVAVSVPGNTSAGQTATDLVAALNASTHPYFSGITWSVQATDNIRGVSDTPGMPFVATLSKSGVGTGTVTNFGGTGTNTANSGPNDWSTAANWSDGAVPANTDTVYVDRGPSICWGLDQNSLSLAALHVMQTFTNKLGLSKSELATSVDGSTVNSSYPEYRQTYLKLSADLITLGNTNNSTTAPNGSSRVKIDNVKSGASNCIVYNTGASVADAGLPAFRYKAANASADVYVQFAPQGVGIAVDVPGETSTIGKLTIADTTQVSRVITGPGVTLTSWIQAGGTNLLQAAATVTTLEVNGGIVTTEGDFTITTTTITESGELRSNHIKSGGNCHTTLNLYNGVCDFQRSNRPRTVSTLNRRKGTLKAHADVLTITTRAQPEKLYTETVT